MNTNIASFLEGTFLFSGITQKDISRLLINANFEEREFSKNEIIYSPERFGKMLGFILEGECEVQRLDAETPIPLNLLKKSSSFGVLAVFSEKEIYPTRIIAKRNTKVLFIRKEDIDKLILESSFVAKNIISFLADRIEFLNEKIATFSQNSVASKLAKYIISESNNNQKCSVALNYKRISEKLNVGRASVYRALDTLIKGKFIYLDEKEIILIDRKGLERI